MPIRLGNMGTFNISRIHKMLNAKDKTEATRMGGADKFADFFRNLAGNPTK